MSKRLESGDCSGQVCDEEKERKHFESNVFICDSDISMMIMIMMMMVTK